MTMSAMRRLGAALFLAGLVAGCSSTRPYVASSENNVRFTTVTESGSFFSSVKASVHIHSVDENCRTNYRGTVGLAGRSTRTGIPVGRPSYLVFSFNSSSFLANSRSSISYKTLLTPRPGRDYEIAVRYVDGMYNATIREVGRRGKRRREVSFTPLASCRARSWKIRK